MMGDTGKACFFFDRDGIVNVSPGAGYVERWEDFRLNVEFVEALRRVAAAGYLAVVVTNQRCVASGIVAMATIQDMHRRLLEWLWTEHRLLITDVLVCPHEDGQCTCRKPQPGLLVEAAARHGIDLRRSWMVGDRETDVLAGHAAGCRTIRIGGKASETESEIWRRSIAALPAAVLDAMGRNDDDG